MPAPEEYSHDFREFSRMQHIKRILVSGLALAFVGAVFPLTTAAYAQTAKTFAGAEVTYADLADLTDSAALVVQVQPRQLVQIEPARATGLRAGEGRFLVQARTRSLIAGDGVVGEALIYLVDLPLDIRGKPPAVKKKDVLVFARAVPGRPGELQLVSRNAQLALSPALDARMRSVLNELRAPGAPPRITGVREAIFVAGNLAGEGETQIFLATANNSAAAMIVNRRPGAAAVWSVSFSEVVDAAGTVPARDTLAWYRLACFLPPELPRAANLSGSRSDKLQAEADYRLAIGRLGECLRSLR